MSGRSKRRRNVALLALAALAALAFAAWLAWPRDDVTRSTVGDAVRSFRSQGGGGGQGAGKGGPRLGVYRYRTRGGEELDGILSTSHDYHGVSTVAVTAGSCGAIERWQVLEGRWNEAESCPRPQGARFRAVREFHEFFGTERKDVFRCSGTSMAVPPFAPVGTRYSSRCEADDAVVATTSRIAGVETLAVGGRSFEAVHTVNRSLLGGSTAGTARGEEWRRRSDGLLLRRRSASDVRISDAGGADYSEHFTIELLDPEPRR